MPESPLGWSTMLATPFLTELDSRAAIKGSRDPLGVQPIWSRLGRHVVGNLTTVSNSVRDFTVLLLGYYFAERVAEEGGSEGDLATFLMWEQLAAYARASINGETGFRGVERVTRRLTEGDRIHLGTDSGAQILSNQKIYGLWGLYTIPGKASGLLAGDPTRLTCAAREVVEQDYLPILAKGGSRNQRALIECFWKSGRALDLRSRSKDAGILQAVATLVGKFRAREKGFYRDHLLYGGPGDTDPARGTLGKQRVFAELLTQTLDEKGWTLNPVSLASLAKQAREKGEVGVGLAERLERIRTCELLIAPTVAFFEYALGCDGQTPREIASAVRKHWGTALRGTIDLEATKTLEPEMRFNSGDVESGGRWMALAQALHGGQFEEALRLVLAQNKAVMQSRSAAAPWVVLQDDKLQVRFRDEQPTQLPERNKLPEYWRHAYFIESLRNVADRLR